MSADDCKRNEMEDKERIVELQRELTITQETLARLSHHVSKLMNHDHLNGEIYVKIDGV